MEVAVYGKEGCVLCSGAKDKLKRLGIEFTYGDLQKAVEVHEGWREDGTTTILAGWAAIDNHVPLIMIDGEPHGYETFVAAVRAKQYVEELEAEATPDQTVLTLVKGSE